MRAPKQAACVLAPAGQRLLPGGLAPVGWCQLPRRAGACGPAPAARLAGA